MTSPAPFISGDVDLRGLDYMPLLGNHLFGSEFNAAASDSEWRAALTLWWAAWNQVPAGSLPADDSALCRLADLGRDLRSWRKLRERALHGFTLCNDGRLYHEFLCEQAVIAWGKRSKERQRKAAWRAEQAAKNGAQPVNVPVNVPLVSPGQDADVPPNGKGRDGTGRDGINTSRPVVEAVGDSAPKARASRLPSDWQLPSDWRDWAKAERPDLDGDRVAAMFRDHWIAKPGKDAARLDWEATWRNWVRKERAPQPERAASPEPEWQRERRERTAKAAPYALAKPAQRTPKNLTIDEVNDVLSLTPATR